jgi:hypothetical protein
MMEKKPNDGSSLERSFAGAEEAAEKGRICVKFPKNIPHGLKTY